MSFRFRVFLLVFTVIGSLVGTLGIWARFQLVGVLAEEHAARVQAERVRIESTLAASERDLAARVTRVAHALADDTGFRLALLQSTPMERRALVDRAGDLAPLSGLDLLEILRSDGSVLSSAHFRESFGAVRRNAGLLLGDVPVLVAVPTAGGGIVRAWGRAERVRIAGQDYLVWGGIAEAGRVLPPVGTVGGVGASEAPRETGSDAVGAGAMLTTLRLDLTTGDVVDEVRPIVVSDRLLESARRALDRGILTAIGASLAAALFLSWAVARSLERPVADLIARTQRVRIGREVVSFETGRKDELGDLGRFIGSMVGRLRDSAEALREAERRAVLGDLARQVHHDVRNGVVPLRGVVRHLEEVAATDPDRLVTVYRERSSTLESGLAYLETLSGHYARLRPRAAVGLVDLGGLLVETAGSWALARPTLVVEAIVEPGLPRVTAEETALRRVLDNLVRNAADAIGEARAGRVLLRGSRLLRRDQIWLEVSVEDDGPGMPPDVVARIFEPFFTTKEEGGGLGLAIVRRLVNDYGGRIDVQSAPGKGTTFRLLLPAASG